MGIQNVAAAVWKLLNYSHVIWHYQLMSWISKEIIFGLAKYLIKFNVIANQYSRSYECGGWKGENCSFRAHKTKKHGLSSIKINLSWSITTVIDSFFVLFHLTAATRTRKQRSSQTSESRRPEDYEFSKYWFYDHWRRNFSNQTHIRWV